MSIERHWWNPRNRQSNKSRHCQTIQDLQTTVLTRHGEGMRGSVGIPVLLNHTQSSSCPSWRLCNQNKVKGKGSARKQIKKTSLGTGFLTEKWVRCLTGENPIRVLLAEYFNYPVGKQADMGRYQMVVWHAVGGQVSAAAHSSSPQGSYHCKHTAITMDTTNAGMARAAY